MGNNEPNPRPLPKDGQENKGKSNIPPTVQLPKNEEPVTPAGSQTLLPEFKAFGPQSFWKRLSVQKAHGVTVITDAHDVHTYGCIERVITIMDGKIVNVSIVPIPAVRLTPIKGDAEKYGYGYVSINTQVGVR